MCTLWDLQKKRWRWCVADDSGRHWCTNCTVALKRALALGWKTLRCCGMKFYRKYQIHFDDRVGKIFQHDHLPLLLLEWCNACPRRAFTWVVYITSALFFMQKQLHCEEKCRRPWIFSHSSAVKFTKVGYYKVHETFSIFCWLYDVWCKTFVQNVCRLLSVKFWPVWGFCSCWGFFFALQNVVKRFLWRLFILPRSFSFSIQANTFPWSVICLCSWKWFYRTEMLCGR